MPPASLSTLAVMKPGPTTASTTMSRTFQALKLRGMSLMSRPSALVPQHRDDVVGGDEAGDSSVLVDDGQRDEVVLVEERRHLRLGRVGGARDVRLADVGEPRRQRRGRDLDERDGAGELMAGARQVDGGQRFAASL